MAKITVVVDMSRLRRVAAAVRDQDGPLRKVYKQWAARMRGFLQERFDTFSKGGGDWAPLAVSTIKGRRKGKKKSKKGPTILRDTGILFAALQPEFVGTPGAVEEDVPFGVMVGYGGPAPHGDGPVSIAEIAGFHQLGGPNLPRREIIVDPSPSVLTSMAGDMERALRTL